MQLLPTAVCAEQLLQHSHGIRMPRMVGAIQEGWVPRRSPGRPGDSMKWPGARQDAGRSQQRC